VPNHELLEALVAVAGGDPSRVGDTDVLLEYFEGLGRGVTRNLAPLRRRGELRLSEAERSYLEREGRHMQAKSRELEHHRLVVERSDRVRAAWRTAWELSLELTGRPFIQYTLRGLDVLNGPEMAKSVSNRDDFTLWWVRIHQVFFEARDAGTLPEGKEYEVPKVRELVLGTQAGDLNALRNWLSHDFHTRGAASQQRISKILMRLIGVSRLADDDTAGFRQLQLRVLEELAELSEAVCAAFLSAHEARARGVMPATAEQPPASIADVPREKRALIFLEAPPL
jgi:hypothetical protein